MPKIPNHVKRFHNIPLHTPTAHFSNAEILRLKQAYKDALPQNKAEACEMGFEMEEKFHKAWSLDWKRYPRWIANVREATEQEDLHEKTDAVITTSRGEMIRVQIKMRKNPPPDLVQSLHEKGIATVSVQLADTPERIRRKTMEAIQRLQSWQKKNSKP